MTQYPLLAGFRALTAGQAYLAAVVAQGRLLAIEEDDGKWWIYGVNPGAMAETGATLLEAHANLMRMFHSYLADVAASAPTFQEFKQEVERFFHQVDEETVAEWEQAVEAVRAGKVDLKDLAKDRTDRPVVIRVELVQVVTPAANALDERPAMAA